jgi:uncharacterized spore protein YtfJ
MPPLKPGKVINSKGNIETKRAPAKKVDPQTARETRKLPTSSPAPRGGPGAKTKTKDAPKPKVKFVGFDPSSTIGSSKKTTVKKPSGGGGGGGGGASVSQSVTIVSAPVASGIVDNVNVKEQYQTEAKRIILSLVRSAKDLLIKYNFSSINRVSEYALDADNESKTEYTIAYKARPEPAFTLGQAELQDRFSLDVAEISNKISDNVPDDKKFLYFGSFVGGRYSPGSVKISGGDSLYDMKLEINSICGKDFIIKCYEIS